VDESGMIWTEMGTRNRSEMVAVLGTAFALLPHGNNSTTKQLFFKVLRISRLKKTTYNPKQRK
jgi:hypothetical protein